MLGPLVRAGPLVRTTCVVASISCDKSVVVIREFREVGRVGLFEDVTEAVF